VGKDLSCIGCRSTCRIFSSVNGTFSDGSGSSTYDANANCQWIIAPINATKITISFIEIATESCCDFIRVFQCPNLDCQGVQKIKIGELSGMYGSPQTAVSNTGFVLVEFMSDGGNSDNGFTATWTSNAPSPMPVPSLPEVHSYSYIYIYIRVHG
jgi:hypothetical protein